MLRTCSIMTHACCKRMCLENDSQEIGSRSFEWSWCWVQGSFNCSHVTPSEDHWSIFAVAPPVVTDNWHSNQSLLETTCFQFLEKYLRLPKWFQALSLSPLCEGESLSVNVHLHQTGDGRLQGVDFKTNDFQTDPFLQTFQAGRERERERETD